MLKIDHSGYNLESLIRPVAEDLGYRLVRIHISGQKNMTLQIMAERADDGTMALEDCQALSGQISAILDVADPLPGAYSLEISSPGLDRPLTAPEDFARFEGHLAKIELIATDPESGRRRFEGEIEGVDPDAGVMTLATEDADWTIPFDRMAKAKLVVTEELIEQAQKEAKRKHKDREKAENNNESQEAGGLAGD